VKIISHAGIEQAIVIAKPPNPTAARQTIAGTGD